MKVLILATEIYARAGIARYISTLGSMLASLLGPENVEVLPLLGSGFREDLPNGYCVREAVAGERPNLVAKWRFAGRALKLAAGRYDLIICAHVCLAPVAALIRLLLGTPYWVACHDTEAWAGAGFGEAVALRRANAVLPVSHFTAAKVSESHGVPPTHITVLPNAIPQEFVQMLVAPDGRGDDGNGEARSQKVLLSVGNLSRTHAYKGFNKVIRVLPALLDSVPNLRYTIVGDGDDRSRLEMLAASLGVREHVTFTGGITQRALAEQYRACDVFVLPSGELAPDGRYRAEGFGRVYVEAALAGKPVVGSRAGGAAEAVVHGKTGFLVDSSSRQELTRTLLMLLQSPELSTQMGQAGREWASKNFTQESVQQCLHVYLSEFLRQTQKGTFLPLNPSFHQRKGSGWSVLKMASTHSGSSTLRGRDAG